MWHEKIEDKKTKAFEYIQKRKQNKGYFQLIEPGSWKRIIMFTKGCVSPYLLHS